MEQVQILTQGYAWFAEAFGLLVLTGVVRFASGRTLARAQLRAEQTANVWDDAMLAAARKPLNLGIWLIGVSLAIDQIITDARLRSRVIISVS